MTHCCCVAAVGCESAAVIAEDMATFLDAGQTITMAGRHAVEAAELREG